MKAIAYLFSILFPIFFSYNVHAQSKVPSIKISHLTGDFYVYTTYKMLDGNPFPSNSMYLVTGNGVVMLDTPWDTTQFQPLMDSIEKRHHKKVLLCIATHFHDDRTIGLDFLKSKGVKTYSSKMTYDLCKIRKDKQAQYYFANDTIFTIGNYSFETYYPGPGHTEDNIVIWFSKEKILYGGCLVKSVENNSLGYIADANTNAWPVSITHVINHCSNPLYIIPGHFGWESKNALQHTLKLLKENKVDKE